MPVTFEEKHRFGSNMRSGKTIPTRGVFVSKDVWVDLDSPLKVDERYVSRSDYNLNKFRDGQVVAVAIRGQLRKCLYLMDSYDKLEGKEYVIHPSNDQASVINIEFHDSRDWPTSITANQSIESHEFEVYMVADALLKDLFSDRLVAGEI